MTILLFRCFSSLFFSSTEHNSFEIVRLLDAPSLDESTERCGLTTTQRIKRGKKMCDEFAVAVSVAGDEAHRRVTIVFNVNTLTPSNAKNCLYSSHFVSHRFRSRIFSCVGFARMHFRKCGKKR